MKRLDSLLYFNLLTVAVLAPLAYGTVEDWSIALFELNALLVGVLLAVRFTWQPFTWQSARDWRQWRLALPLLGLVLLGGLQLLPLRTGVTSTEVWQAAQAWRTLSLDAQATRESVVKLSALLIYFIAALHVLRDGQRRRKLVLTLTVLGATTALFAIVQKLTWNGKFYWLRPASPYIAPFGPFANYNHFAGMMELLLPLAFTRWLFVRSETGQRALWFFAVILMAGALLYSLSRGGMLALGLQLVVLFWLVWRGRRAAPNQNSQPLLIALAVSLIAIFAIWIGYDALLWRFQSLQQGAQEYSVVTRLEYWRGAWQMFRDHPVTGVGLGAFPAIYPHYGHASAKLERLEKAHNDYLQVLTDAGLVGGVLLLWFLVELIRQLYRQMRRLAEWPSQERATLLGGYLALLGMAVHSLLDFNLQITANAYLFLLLLALVSMAHKTLDKPART